MRKAPSNNWLSRRSFVGGSDARIIMGSDEAALVRLWREKRGEAEPEDLSGNLIVRLGIATEELNRTWYERNTGRRVTDVQRRVKHSAIPWMMATLDGVVEGVGAVFEAKFMLPWSFSEEAAAEKYMAQVQHNMWVTFDEVRDFPRMDAPPEFFLRRDQDTEVERVHGYRDFNPLSPASDDRQHRRPQVPMAYGRVARRLAPSASTFSTWRKPMHRSSESVAALASALAKAQAELVNPEKSLTATVRDGRGGEGGRIFRYAPLSSGLDIVRKTLGQHEIATMQTTAIDPPAGIVKLTTMLAHASGEWIALDWPVCPLAEMASPQRMGAALTYARRYALFTLVGIAGEDDLDAPDMGACVSAADREASPSQDRFPARGSRNGPLPGTVKNSTVVLDPPQSAALRDKLLAEIANLMSAEFAVTWAAGALSAKNSLIAADAKLLEEAFEQKLSGLQPSAVDDTSTSERAATLETRPEDQPQASDAGRDQARGIDKSVLAIAAPRRYRNREHLRYVTQQPCLVCGRKPSDPHHLRHVQPRALGRKASDEFAVPLCRSHHRAVHRASNEQAWWQATGIDPIKVARKLWKLTRVNEGRIQLDGRRKTAVQVTP